MRFGRFVTPPICAVVPYRSGCAHPWVRQVHDHVLILEDGTVMPLNDNEDDDAKALGSDPTAPEPRDQEQIEQNGEREVDRFVRWDTEMGKRSWEHQLPQTIQLSRHGNLCGPQRESPD
jgi:hypothetical protein